MSDLNTHRHGGADRDGRSALIWALALNGAFLVVEAAVGFATGSLALLSDAAHMVTDVGALALALAAAQLARRAATPDRSFGLRRAEILGAFVNALFLLVTCVLIFREATVRLMAGPEAIAGWPVLATGVIGLAINLASAWYLSRAGRDNLNVRAALAHMLADALGSVGAIVAAIFMLNGFAQADAAVSIAVGALILVGAWRVLRPAARVLLQFAPEHLSCVEVRAAIAATSGVCGVHDLHVWTVDSREAVASVHVVAAPGASPPEVRRRVSDLLGQEFGIRHSTVQTECEEEGECAREGCPLRSAPLSTTPHCGGAHG